ncbi:MAG TPA: uracil phosphoribosyltransferase, partial [Armatimonadetes bacterium]|nr:uracil phosphoribosyltransferase [Armatimonadota bacterium]
MPVRVCSHPLAQHLLGRLRDKSTPPDQYRRYADTLARQLALEATHDLPTAEVAVQTPLTRTLVRQIDQGLAVVPILRAGLGLLDAWLELFPDVSVGYIGLERDEETAQPRSYYAKLPQLESRYVVCLDPMLATGGSAARALSLIKEHKPDRLKLVVIIAAPEGIARVEAEHPEIEIVTAAVDEGLN